MGDQTKSKQQIEKKTNNTTPSQQVTPVFDAAQGLSATRWLKLADQTRCGGSHLWASIQEAEGTGSESETTGSA